MLNNRDLEEKTFEELMTEALMEIPLYTKEWTNFTPADPGMTILESLTAFEILQQNHINQITPEVRTRLMDLLGFHAAKGRCAMALLGAENLKGRLHIPANQKFRLGDVCYETNRAQDLYPCHLTGIYSCSGEKWQDCSYLLDPEVKIPAAVFGNKPAPDDSLWIVSDSLPPAGTELIFYMTVADSHNRNPFTEKGNNTFAQIRWECYTENGFEAMHVKDNTGCFLVDGELRMRLPETEAAPCSLAPSSGYVIRATLEKAQYDVVPKLSSVYGFLFDVWQKDTRSICHTFNRVTNLSLRSEVLKEGYIMIFCKEQKGSSYRRYTRSNFMSVHGRYYDLTEDPDGTMTFFFDRQKYGYGPEKVKNPVKIVAYTEEIMRRYDLGAVNGMDNQEIRLPMGQVVADSFCIIAERTDENGERLYDFVRPGRYGEDDLSYSLYEESGRIVIEDAGAFIGAHLYMGSFAVTMGENGNIREGNTLIAEDLEGVSFYNPRPGTGGRFRETFEQLKRRFLEDLEESYTAVTAGDYERIVKETPQLCIHKVKAFLDESRNLVRIAVKPDTDAEFPKLSDYYRESIEHQLDDRRLLTTRIEVTGPVYARVDVSGTVYVRRNYENCREQIEETIRRAVDCVHSERNFGEPIRFDRVFHAIENLDCVEFVYELSLIPRSPGLTKLVDSDVIPAENCLCYAGEILIETVIDRL